MLPCKLNKHKQPILPNIFLLTISVIFIFLMNATKFMNDFFKLMSFGCACTYAITMISAVAMLIMLAIALFCTLGNRIMDFIWSISRIWCNIMDLHDISKVEKFRCNN